MATLFEIAFLGLDKRISSLFAVFVLSLNEMLVIAAIPEN